MVRKFKVLNADMTSPFQGFQYELAKEYTCRNFDESEESCAAGFYATDLEGIVYSFRIGRRAFEAEMSGREKKFDQFKQRWEKITIIREIPEDELKELLKKESKKIGYNMLEACFPINPLEFPEKEITEREIHLFKKWISVMDSVEDSVWDSVWDSVEDSVEPPVWYYVGDYVADFVQDSVWDSVRNSVAASVWASVFDSVWDSVGENVRVSVKDSVMDSVEASMWASVGHSVRASVMAYISSLFPGIKKWKGMDHKEGENPFQAGIDLWKSGFVPSFDGTTWRLQAGKDAKIVYEWRKN